MAGIGGVSCNMVKGEAPAKKERLRVWQVPGIDGYGAHADGLGDSAFVFLGVKYGLRAAIETWSTAIEALQGSVVSIVNDWGTTYTNCLIQHVSVPRITAALWTGVDTRGEIRVEGVVI